MAGVISLALAGCVSDPYHQGNYVDGNEIAKHVGKSTREEVEKEFGSPSFQDPNNKNVVYYIGAQGIKKPLVSPTIDRSSSIRLEYDANNRLVKATNLAASEKK